MDDKIDLHPEDCGCGSCTYQPNSENLEAKTYINLFLLEDLDAVAWAVRREANKYHKWEIPSYLEESLKALNSVDIMLKQYRTNTLKMPEA